MITTLMIAQQILSLSAQNWSMNTKTTNQFQTIQPQPAARIRKPTIFYEVSPLPLNNGQQNPFQHSYRNAENIVKEVIYSGRKHGGLYTQYERNGSHCNPLREPETPEIFNHPLEAYNRSTIKLIFSLFFETIAY